MGVAVAPHCPRFTCFSLTVVRASPATLGAPAPDALEVATVSDEAPSAAPPSRKQPLSSRASAMLNSRRTRVRPTGFCMVTSRGRELQRTGHYRKRTTDAPGTSRWCGLGSRLAGSYGRPRLQRLVIEQL